MTEFNSQDFFTHIKKLADAYNRNIDKISGKTLVQYNSKTIDKIKELYPLRLELIKKEIYGDCYKETGNKIDRHKIISLYIQLFLENPVFNVLRYEKAPYPNIKIMLINEIFCLDIMTVILQEWTGKKLNSEKQIKGLEFVFLELPKYKPSNTNEQNYFNLWLMFLTEINEETKIIPDILLQNRELRDAIKCVEESSLTRGELDIYDRVYDAIWSRKALIRGKRREALEEGIAKGEARGLAKGKKIGKAEGGKQKAAEIAKEMKLDGMAIEKISKLTGLSTEEIEKL